MPRTPKETPKGNGSPKGNGGKKAEEKQEPLSPADEAQAQLAAARAELMRAQRDLETVRLELVEQKRKASQHALVHGAELKEARSERESLRMQLDALRGELAAP